MQEGDVIVASIRQADGTLKKRPLIVLRRMPPYNDLLVCGVSKQLQQEAAGFDEVISLADTDFADSGLKSSSLIRLGFLAVFPVRDVAGAIGFISFGVPVFCSSRVTSSKSILSVIVTDTFTLSGGRHRTHPAPWFDCTSVRK